MKILQSLWFWIYTALTFWAGAVFLQSLHSALAERDWLFYGCYSLLYPLIIFIVGRFCVGQFSKVKPESIRTFHLTVFTAVNLLLAGWILLFAALNFVWFPYSLIVWGICLWSSSSDMLSVKSGHCHVRFLGVIILFLAPLVTIFYVLTTAAEDARLAEQQRVQESRKETVQLNARLINQSLEKLKQQKKLGKEIAELHSESTYILDEATREKQCSGKRSPELSALLTDVRKNSKLIESWFSSKDLSSYSHAFLLFALGEYEKHMSRTIEIESASQSNYKLPQPMKALQNRLRFALTGVAPEDYFVLSFGEIHVTFTQETIFSEIAAIKNSSIRLTKKMPPQTSWSERISILEGVVFLYHASRKSISPSGLSHRFSLFCLGWLSILMLVVLLYSRHRDRIAREKLDIASTVAHEFRTPLTGMSVLIDNLLEDKNRESQKVTSYLQKMKSSNQRLHQISEHFFIEGALKQKNIKLETVNWSSWVAEQWEEFIALHQSGSISFDSSIQPSEKTALLDQALLSLALQNILRNAFLYTQQGSVSIALVESDCHLGIEVKDTGIGMDSSIIKSVFHKYNRGEDSLSRETEGLGLGLYLALEIAKLHDGEITIKSTPSIGSTFTLWICK